ncbi:MAG: hypothetical protein HFJ09_00595 [Lachnospiraceae bacterium]|nr:hypothetical protein [Lachnospiraceae bacterium]
MEIKDNIEDKQRTGMDRVREFDEKLLSMNSDKVLIRRIVAYFFEFLICIMFVAFCDESSWQTMHWVIAIYYSFAIKIHLDVYMTIYENDLVIGEERHSISIYQLLKKFPVNPRDIFKVRLFYLWKMLYKRLIILYILQLPFIVYHNKLKVVNIVYPVFVIVMAAIVCMFLIRPKK